MSTHRSIQDSQTRVVSPTQELLMLVARWQSQQRILTTAPSLHKRSGVKSSVAAALSRHWRDRRDPSEMAQSVQKFIRNWRYWCQLNIHQSLPIIRVQVNMFCQHHQHSGLTLKATRGFLPLAHHLVFPADATQLRPFGSWLRTVLRRPPDAEDAQWLLVASLSVSKMDWVRLTFPSRADLFLIASISSEEKNDRGFWDALLITLSHVSLELCSHVSCVTTQRSRGEFSVPWNHAEQMEPGPAVRLMIAKKALNKSWVSWCIMWIFGGCSRLVQFSNSLNLNLPIGQPVDVFSFVVHQEGKTWLLYYSKRLPSSVAFSFHPGCET